MKKFTSLLLIISVQTETVAQDSSTVFTDGYQRSINQWTRIHLRRQKPFVTCNGETIFFSGEISYSSVSKLFRLVNMDYPSSLEIAEMLSEVEVSYYTNMPFNPKCNNNTTKKDSSLKLKKREQDPVVGCQPKKIVISSQGGNITAALRLYYFIQKLSLSVKIPNYGICMSACTHIRHFSESFSAGPNSAFMFHRPHLMGHTLVYTISQFKTCLNDQDFINDQTLEAFWQLEVFFPEQVIEGINQFEDFFVPYHVLETWNY